MMKKVIIFIVLLCNNIIATAQNVGIGTTEPMNKLQVAGNLLVSNPTLATNTVPTPGQTKTMVNASTILFNNADSTGRIYEPGGPAGNYLANVTANAQINGVSGLGIEVTAEIMDLGLGDSLIIKYSSNSTDNFLAVGNGYNITGKWVFNTPTLYIIFKSNADANRGIGFSLLFKRLYNDSPSLPDFAGAAGSVLLFDTKNGSFRSGYLDYAARGLYSTAMGLSPSASGDYSTAMGSSSSASGNFSTAMGSNTSASGNFSTAMGNGTSAGGEGSIAIGYQTTASGDYSTAMGSYVSTNNLTGSFVIGDNSTSTVMNAANDNNFRARFAGGYKLFTSTNLSTGCTLFAGDNAWTTGSDVRTKENFAEVNGEDFLKMIAGFHLTSWNYKTQDPKTFRHYGPMAQDFYAAFGKDKYGNIGNDTTINSADFAGVSLIAIQALEKRTVMLKEESDKNIIKLRKELEASNALIQNQQKQIDELKAMINKLAQGVVLK